MARKPRKPRNYRAEEARRNEIARALGFKSRAEMRKAVETGKIAPKRPRAVRSPRTIAAQKAREARERAVKVVKRGHTDSYESLSGGISDEQRAQDWSDIFARTDVSTYEYGVKNATAGEYKKVMAAKARYVRKHGKDAYTKAYLKAFVEGPGKYKTTRNIGGSPDLYLWFVIVCEYLLAELYEDKYASKGK